MPNSIVLAKSYQPIVDRVYAVESKTAILDAPSTKIRFKGGNKAEIFKISVDGYGDYSRNNGYKSGSVTSTWEELTLEKDRAISLNVDCMDNEETLDLAFANTVSEFLRTKAIPEMDAYRFAKYATAAVAAGATQYASADVVVGTTDIPAAISVAEQALREAEAPEGSILFVSPATYAALEAKVTRSLANENGVNKEIIKYNSHPVVIVPQSRFYTAVTLNDGTSAFGYSIPSGAYKINFLLVDPSAIVQAVKHNPLKVFTPEQNQDRDGWMFQTRCYHDAFVLANKTKGLYVHKSATATE